MKLIRLDPDDDRPEFSCGDGDLDEFYATDSRAGGRELVCVTYAYVAEDSGDVLAFFSVSNDSIKREDLSRSGFRRVMEEVPHPKRYKSMPAAKIGRLGTCVKHQSSGIGTQVLDYLKVWFTVGNKTGCRFLVVDANNNTRALAFYERNGFEFLTPDDVDEGTRIMYFDLIKFRE